MSHLFTDLHASLGSSFFVPVSAAKPPQAILRYRNQEAAQSIGLDKLSDEAWLSHFAYFTPFEGSLPQPLALAYHGHQFGVYNPDIGDGRGFLFAQIKQSGTGRLLDFGTKGTGQTPFSRQGDGRLTLKGAVREILATELLQSLGVPTSKTLSVVETGEALSRHDEPSPARSAYLVRLSESHIRIGSFQRLHYLKQGAEKEQLLRYVVRQYYPAELYPMIDPDASLTELVPAFLSAFARRVAHMTAGWMAAGFVHGVLNTDNFNLTGESFDYGPWRFLPHLSPSFTAAYFDQQGRYAYGRQPDAALWALCRFADCFIEEVPQDALEQALSGFFAEMETKMVRLLLQRLGIDASDGVPIMNAFLKAARESGVSLDAACFDLYGQLSAPKEIYEGDVFVPYFAALAAGGAQAKPRTHAYFNADEPSASLVIDEVERVWERIASHDDWSALTQKCADIRAYGVALGHRNT